MVVRLEIDPRTPLGYRMVTDDASDPAQDEAGVVVAGRATVEVHDATPDLDPTTKYDTLVRGWVLDDSRVHIEVFDRGAWHPLPEIPDVSVEPWTANSWYAEGAIVLVPSGAGWAMWRADRYIPAPGTTPSTSNGWKPIVAAALAALEARITALEER